MPAKIIANPLASHGMSKRKLYPKPLFDEEMVLAACDEAGIKRQHVYKMWRSLIQGTATSVEEIEGLPKQLLHIATTDFKLTTSQVEKVSHSEDGATTKLLVKLQDDKMVEAVIMRYGSVQFSSYMEQMEEQGVAVPDMSQTGFRSKPRATLCLSSQVGCAMGCTFCATGTMNLQGNLTSGEILEQLWHANKVEKIRNIVFMGMGEPLDNYGPVLSSIKGMCDVQRWSLKQSQVSLSTVGVVPNLLKLANDAPWVNLALSLHAPNNALRQKIVPSTKAWHIDKIMAALDNFIVCQNACNQKVKNTLIEYVLIRDVNDSDEVAHELGALLQDRPVVLNVIPYNVTDVPHDYKPPSQARNVRFIEVVRTYGVKTIQRQKLGDDIAGACGQLVVRTVKSKEPKSDGGPVDLEDIMGKDDGRVLESPASVRKPSGVRIKKIKTINVPLDTISQNNEKEKAEADSQIATSTSPVQWALVLGILGLAILAARLIPRLLE